MLDPHQIGQLLQRLGRGGRIEQQPLAGLIHHLAAVAEDERVPGPPLEGLVKGRAVSGDRRRVEANFARMFAVGVHREFFGGVDELLPGPRLGRIGGRVGQAGAVEQVLVVEKQRGLHRRIQPDDLAITVVVARLRQRGGEERVGLHQVGQIEQLAFLRPQRRLQAGEVTHVGRLALLHHRRDPGEVFLVGNLDGLHIHVGVARLKRGHHLLDGGLLHIGTPVGEGQFRDRRRGRRGQRARREDGSQGEKTGDQQKADEFGWHGGLP